MHVQIELWALLTFLIGLLVTFLGCVFGFAKVLGGQIDKRLEERFSAQDAARREGQKVTHAALTAHLEEERRDAEVIRNLEREFLRFQADLPVHYVRREDYVRGQTVIEAKLDALYNKLEVVQIKGAGHG
jgi:hypothetical protein